MQKTIFSLFICGALLLTASHRAEAQGSADADAAYRAAYQAYAGSARPDYARAFELAKRAAQGGSAQGAFLLATLYEAGQGTDRSLSEARKWFEAAAVSGDRAAMLNLGVVESRQHDNGAAAVAFKSAAEKGLASAQAAYGQSLETGQGVERDEKEAITWYRLSAEGGDAVGAFLYGSGLLRGIGGLEKNPMEAPRWFQSAAGQDIGAAQLALGLAYTEGTGLAKDPVAAAGWFKKAAAHEVPDAMFNYAVALSRGLGTAKNAPEAVKLYRRLAAYGHADAMQALAAHYFSGEGVAPNPSEAYYWAALSLRFYKLDDPKRTHAVELKSLIEKNLSMGERINRDVRTATFKPAPEPPVISPLVLIRPSSPTQGAEPVRVAVPRPQPEPEQKKEEAPAPAAESGPSTVARFLPGFRSSGASMEMTGGDESGVAPLHPEDLPVSHAPAVAIPGADEAGAPPLDPKSIPTAPPPKPGFVYPYDEPRYDN